MIPFPETRSVKKNRWNTRPLLAIIADYREQQKRVGT